MTWVRSSSKASVQIDAAPDTVRTFLADVVRCGRLMPSVKSLTHEGGNLYAYELDEFNNGTISLAPKYQATWDLSDPAELRWEPHGEHNFRTWGVFRTREGATPQETILEIDTYGDADLPVPSVMVPLVRPFANKSNNEVSKGFLANIKAEVERQAVSGEAGR